MGQIEVPGQTKLTWNDIVFFSSRLAGTGEGDVEDAEKLLQPYLKQYPKVSEDICIIYSSKVQLFSNCIGFVKYCELFGEYACTHTHSNQNSL